MSDKDRIDLPQRGITTYDTAIFTDKVLMTASPAFGHCATGSALDRYADALRFFDTVNRYGIDRVYVLPGLVDFVVTLFEDGILTEGDTGMELNREFDTLLKLLRMIALREGVGDLLADGILQAAHRIGRGVQRYVQNVMKGQFITSDPRLWGLGPMQFEQMVYPGRSLGVAAAMGVPTYSPGRPMKELLRQASRCGIPEEAKGRIFTETSFNTGRPAKHGEDFFCLFNMLGQCHRLYISRFFSIKMLADLYSSVSGIPTIMANLKIGSERTWNLWKWLNYRAGFTRKDDEPPEIWFQPLHADGREYVIMDYFQATPLVRTDVDRLLDDYYEERGWDKKTGVPTPQKLKDLGLENTTPQVEPVEKAQT
jgi:aldehyde:ferredoxin oxidoreductase